jgi:hypothetical protein
MKNFHNNLYSTINTNIRGAQYNTIQAFTGFIAPLWRLFLYQVVGIDNNEE